MLNGAAQAGTDSKLALPVFFRQALENLWQEKVAELPVSCQQRLRLPQIVLNPDLKVWGRWTPLLQRIELRTALMTDHPWYAIEDVFGHEIAHQVLSCCFAGVQEAPHGPTFRRICNQLRVSCRASDDYPLLNEVVFGGQAEADTPERKMLQRIQKLLALSASSNRHEAEVALAKARELAGKYNLESQMHAHAAEDAYYSVAIGELMLRRDAVIQLASWILDQYYEVTTIWIKDPDLARERWAWRLYIQGRRPQILVATYAYDCMLDYVRRSWESQPDDLRKGGCPQTARRDFGLGVLTAFRDALDRQNREPQMRALVQQRDAGLLDYFEWLYPRRHAGRRRTGAGIDDDLWAAGQAAGRDLHIHPGLDRTAALPKRLSGG